MQDEADIDSTDKKKSGGKKGFIFGLLGAILVGGGGFYAAYSGLVLPDQSQKISNLESPVTPLPDIVFIALDPMVISLGNGTRPHFLRFSAQLDVDPASEAEVRLVLPRIKDVLNTFLRAVSEEELGKSNALERMRAQMLRRIQVVTSAGQVKDLLITEFVLG